MGYKVLQIVTCDTIQVAPEWRIWKLGKGGDQVRVNGCQLPEGSGTKMRANVKVKMFNLLSGNRVEIKNVYKTEGKIVTADVFINGKNVSEFFPELKGSQEISDSASH